MSMGASLCRVCEMSFVVNAGKGKSEEQQSMGYGAWGYGDRLLQGRDAMLASGYLRMPPSGVRVSDLGERIEIVIPHGQMFKNLIIGILFVVISTIIIGLFIMYYFENSSSAEFLREILKIKLSEFIILLVFNICLLMLGLLFIFKGIRDMWGVTCVQIWARGMLSIRESGPFDKEEYSFLPDYTTEMALVPVGSKRQLRMTGPNGVYDGSGLSETDNLWLREVVQDWYRAYTLDWYR